MAEGRRGRRSHWVASCSGLSFKVRPLEEELHSAQLRGVIPLLHKYDRPSLPDSLR